MHKAKFLTLVAALVSSVTLVGCGGPASNNVNVTGTVTYKNEPLKGGRLKFFNAKNEQVSMANVTPDGTFTATDLPKDKVKVTVESGDPLAKITGKAPPGTPVIDSGAPAGKGVPVPAKYSKVETTDLAYTITQADQKLEVKLE